MARSVRIANRADKHMAAFMQPRGMTREEAAAYCGCESLAAFSDWVRRGIIPGPLPGNFFQLAAKCAVGDQKVASNFPTAVWRQ